MKFEFIKEVKANGGVLYYTKADGRFVDGSLDFKEDKAKEMFDFYVRNNTTKSAVETVVETVETEDEVVTAKYRHYLHIKQKINSYGNLQQ